MWEELHRIKCFRERKAAAEVFRCQRLLEQRKREADHAKAMVREHREYRMFRERSLFEEIEGRQIQLRRLERMRGEIARMREAEALLQQKVVSAEKALEESRRAWDERRRQHDLAAREKEKFVQLLEIHRREIARALEKGEEMELEEFSPPAGGLG